MADIAYSALNNSTQIPQLMQQNQAAGQALQAGQLSNEQKQDQYASLVLGTAAKSGNPDLFQSARQHLSSLGIDTTPFSTDPNIALKQAQFGMLAGATPTETMRAMMMDQEMRQRAGSQTTDMGSYGYNGNNAFTGLFDPVNNDQQSSGGQTQPTQQNPQQPQQAYAQPSKNPPPFVAPQQPQDNSQNGMTTNQVLASGINPPTANGSVLPPQPVQGATEPTKAYAQRLKAWNEAAENNLQQQQNLSEKKSAGSATTSGSDALSADAGQAQRMVNTLAAIQDARKNFQSGALAPAQQSILRLARAMDYPITPQQISELSSEQVFNKVSMDLIGTAAKAEGQASRLQSAFQAIKDANPSLGIEPETLDKLVPFMSSASKNILDQQQQWNTAKNQNPNLSYPDFYRNFVAQTTEAQQKNNGALQPYDFGKNNPPSKDPSAPDSGFLQTPSGVKYKVLQ